MVAAVVLAHDVSARPFGADPAPAPLLGAATMLVVVAGQGWCLPYQPPLILDFLIGIPLHLDAMGVGWVNSQFIEQAEVQSMVSTHLALGRWRGHHAGTSPGHTRPSRAGR